MTTKTISKMSQTIIPHKWGFVATKRLHRLQVDRLTSSTLEWCGWKAARLYVHLRLPPMGSARPMDPLFPVHHDKTVRRFGETFWLVFKLLHLCVWSSHWISVSTNIRGTGYSHQRWGPKNPTPITLSFEIQILISTQLKLIEESGSKEQWIIGVDGAGPDFELPEHRFLGGEINPCNFSETSSDLVIFVSSLFLQTFSFSIIGDILSGLAPGWSQIAFLLGSRHTSFQELWQRRLLHRHHTQ